MAPALVTACIALPPEGARQAWGGPALAAVAPTLATAYRAAFQWCRYACGLAMPLPLPWFARKSGVYDRCKAFWYLRLPLISARMS